MAFGQTGGDTPYSWGVAPGYDDERPSAEEIYVWTPIGFQRRCESPLAFGRSSPKGFEQ